MCTSFLSVNLLYFVQNAKSKWYNSCLSSNTSQALYSWWGLQSSPPLRPFWKKIQKSHQAKTVFFWLVMPYTHLMGLIVMKKQVTTTIKLISKPRSAWDFWMMITRNGAWRCIFSVKMHAAFCWRFLVHHSKAGASSFTFVMRWWLLQQQLVALILRTLCVIFPYFPGFIGQGHSRLVSSLVGGNIR